MDNTFSQFALNFSSIEEMEAYKKEAQLKQAKLNKVSITIPAYGTEPDKEEKSVVVSPTVRPQDNADKKETFRTIRQGTSTNALTKMRARESKGLTIDRLTGNLTIKSGDYTLTLPKEIKPTDLKTSTFQLFDALTIAFTESGGKSPTVIIPLKEYMETRGLKDRKEAKNQASTDLAILKTASFSSVEKKGKHIEKYEFVNYADKGTVAKNGDIIFTFGNTFYNILLSYTTMPYAEQALNTDNKNNPNSFNFLRKINEHKNMNIGKKNEDIIAVKTLLNSAPIDTYEEVMAKDRALKRHIIKPFERDMNALKPTLSWNYCHKNGVPLTPEELTNIDYHTFTNLLVHIEWNEYPDQTARLERKAKAIEEAKKKKEKAERAKKKKE